MPEPFDKYDPTEADIDMVIETTIGKPVRTANAAAGVASMLQRIAEREKERAQLEEHREAGSDSGSQANYAKDIFYVDADLATARKRLADYQSQAGKQN